MYNKITINEKDINEISDMHKKIESNISIFETASSKVAKQLNIEAPSIANTKECLSTLNKCKNNLLNYAQCNNNNVDISILKTYKNKLEKLDTSFRDISLPLVNSETIYGTYQLTNDKKLHDTIHQMVGLTFETYDICTITLFLLDSYIYE